MSAPDKIPTRVRILDIAEQEFATRGYRGASLSEIASGVGIRTPSLYKHFASKQSLYDAVLDRLLEPFVAALTDLIQPPKNAEDAQRNVVAVFRLYVKSPNCARVLQHAALAGEQELQSVILRLAPLLSRASELTDTTPGVADPTAVAHLVLAFHHMLTGYVITAPLLAGWTGAEPFGEEALAIQEQILCLLSRSLWRSAEAEAQQAQG